MEIYQVSVKAITCNVPTISYGANAKDKLKLSYFLFWSCRQIIAQAIQEYQQDS
jgi:hypothetical protein